MANTTKLRFGITLVVFQLLFIILFGAFVRYDDPASPVHASGSDTNDSAVATAAPSVSYGDDAGNDEAGKSNAILQDVLAKLDKQPLPKYYPMFQDVHVMIFIGFGFLMTFLKRYGFSSVGFNMLVACFAIQWSILFSGFLHMRSHHMTINVQVTNMLTADFASAAVLITFGALLGKTSPLQMILIAFIEIMVFSINEYVGLEVLHAVDVGGSMFVHTFGAYFGLALSRVLWKKQIEQSSNEGSVYHSDLFAMIGTVFLWLYWPSFNAALAPEDAQHRAVLNTYLALVACCVVTFAVSALVDKEGKLDMVHVQNATLAGGVAVGTSADLMIHPVGALVVGTLAGALSTCGYRFITPFLNSRLKIHDTCGVNNLHGMPGILAGIIGAIVAGIASEDHYGATLHRQFPALSAGRSAAMQGVFQFIALLMTFAVAIISGALTGLLIRLSIFDAPRKTEPLFDDGIWWETPEDFAKYQAVDREDKNGNGDKLAEASA